MATLTPNSTIGFLELSKRTSDKGLMAIAEVLNANQGRILEDIPWFQCNQILSEKIARRTSLPQGTWRQINEGVAAEASTTQTVVEPTALLEARSQIDEDLVDNAPNPMEFRRTEDLAFVEGLAQHFAKTLIWGTTEGAATSNPEEINGLQQRLAAYSQTTVLDGGSTDASAVTSVYIVNWGRNGAYCIYPAAAANRGPLGLTLNDKGKESVIDSSDNTKAYYAYVSQFKWWVGLAVRDEDAIGRYANIATSGTSNTFHENKLIELLNLGRFDGPGTRIYFNKTIATQAQIKLKDKGNMVWAYAQGLSGAPLLTFNGIPCRALDTNIILNTEEVLAS